MSLKSLCAVWAVSASCLAATTAQAQSPYGWIAPGFAATPNCATGNCNLPRPGYYPAAYNPSAAYNSSCPNGNCAVACPNGQCAVGCATGQCNTGYGVKNFAPVNMPYQTQYRAPYVPVNSWSAMNSRYDSRTAPLSPRMYNSNQSPFYP